MIDYNVPAYSREMMEQLCLDIVSGQYSVQQWKLFVMGARFYQEQVEDDPLLYTALSFIQRIDELTRDDPGCRGSALSKALGLSRRGQDKSTDNHLLAHALECFRRKHGLSVDAAAGANEASTIGSLRDILREAGLPVPSANSLKDAHRAADLDDAAAAPEQLDFWIKFLRDRQRNR